MVEHNLAKVGVESSNLFARSKFAGEIKYIAPPFGAAFCFPVSDGAGKRSAAGDQGLRPPAAAGQAPKIQPVGKVARVTPARIISLPPPMSMTVSAPTWARV
ncbi:MAG: hypothetical protein JWQ52_1677 [Phenylobacterium sp.]|nr:hypothetical protein [Phenylobacterium sp.]